MVNSNKVELDAKGGNFSVMLQANVSISCEIDESAKGWLSVVDSRGLSSHIMNFVAKSNDCTERRQGNILFKGEKGLTETVTVYQEGGEESSIVLTTEPEMTIDSEGGILKIELESNLDEVRMEIPDLGWLRESSSRVMNSYTYYIEVDANDSFDERNASVNFWSGDLKQTVTIVQKQKDGLTVTSDKVEINSSGGDVTIEVMANVNFEYEIDESDRSWITESESRGLSVSTLSFHIDKNNETSARSGKIYIRSGELADTVTIYQKGTESEIVLTQKNYMVDSKGENIKVELRSNVDYEIEMPDVDWIIEDKSRGMSVYTHYFDVLPNEEYDSRTEIIRFVNKEMGASEEVIITQKQKDAIVVANREYEMTSEGGNFDITVNANVDFDVDISVNWISLDSGSRAMEDKILNFIVQENTGDVKRNGIITLSSGSLEETIVVHQEGQYIFALRQREYVVDNIGETIDIIIDSDEDYTVETENVDWLTKVKNDYGIKNIYSFVVSPNEGYESRSTKVYIKDNKGNCETVSIIQKQTDVIMVAQNEYFVAAERGDWELEVTANVDFNITVLADWIVMKSESRGLRNDRLVFSIMENTGNVVREGKIMLSYNELFLEIKVKQDKKGNSGNGLDDFHHGGSM